MNIYTVFKITVTATNLFLKFQISLYFNEISSDIQSPTIPYRSIKEFSLFFLPNELFERFKIDICHLKYLPDHDNHN